MGKRGYLIGAVGVVALLAGYLVLEWRLTRDVGGVDCPQFELAEVDALGLDFTSRFTEEKQILKFEIRTARDQVFPDCFISNSAFRCSVEGPAMVRTKIWRDGRYFGVDAGEMMTIAGTEDYVKCGVEARNRVP